MARAKEGTVTCTHPVRRGALAVLLCAATASLGCSSFTATVAGVAVGTTLAGAYTPAHGIEQIYYLGTFDRQGQLPPQFYRLTVRGQASIISNMRFGSGWVRAEVIDAIEGWSPAGSDAEGGGEVDLKEGRALVQYGPEGFREAPRDHRLVIVMGGDPSAFFKAMDMSLGNVARVQSIQRQSAFSQAIFAEYVALNRQHDRLVALQHQIETSVEAPTR